MSGLLRLRFVKLLKVHLRASHFNFAPWPHPLSGHRQTKRHASLIPEYHHITHTQPDAGSWKLLPPLHSGEIAGEEDPKEEVRNWQAKRPVFTQLCPSMSGLC